MTNKDLPPEIAEALKNPSVESEEQSSDDELDISKWVRLKRLKADDKTKTLIEGETVGKKIARLFELTVVIPEPKIAYPLLAAYASIPSVLCDILPILELRGEPESGKSECIKIFSRVTGSILNARSTAASIKNDINQIRWVDPSTFSTEKICFYLLDNADTDFFEERDVLTAFLNGYDRYTDKQSISNGKGQNIPFYVFCPKVVSTVWRINGHELRRRLLTIKFKPKADLSDLVEPESLAINSLKKELNEFWANSANWDLYYQLKDEVKLSYPRSQNRQQWKLVTDVITSGLCTGVWDSPSKAFEFFEAYFASRANAKEGVYESILADTLAELSGIPQKEWKTSPPGIVIEVDPKELKNKIDVHVDSGLIPKIKPDQIQLDVRALGWGIANKGGKYIYKFLKK
ncbi:hypothetical protein QUA71_26085 [Microcoleus sp. MON1_C5]|uniref:hypothetical protein n=1 Tax=Microcoleus sp. MON1_C5 TaxID=2818828 RepID=UPI002FD2DEFE